MFLFSNDFIEQSKRTIEEVDVGAVGTVAIDFAEGRTTVNIAVEFGVFGGDIGIIAVVDGDATRSTGAYAVATAVDVDGSLVGIDACAGANDGVIRGVTSDGQDDVAIDGATRITATVDARFGILIGGTEGAVADGDGGVAGDASRIATAHHFIFDFTARNIEGGIVGMLSSARFER